MPCNTACVLLRPAFWCRLLRAVGGEAVCAVCAYESEERVRSGYETAANGFPAVTPILR
jgi:hypothetical protein